MDSTLVIKVKWGDTIRRFVVYAEENGLLDLDMCRLNEKIYSFFKFAPNVDLSLTYFDQDNDVVSLVDDDDLCEAIRQDLNPLRINVVVNSVRARMNRVRLKRSCSPKESLQVKHPPSPIDYGVNEGVLKILQEKLLDAFLKLSLELTTKVMSLVLTELVDCLSKLEPSHPAPDLEIQESTRNGEKFTSECPGGLKVAEESESFKDMAEPKALSRAEVEEPVQEDFQKDMVHLDTYKDMTEQKTILGTTVEEPVQENFEKEKENGDMEGAAGTLPPPTTSPVHPTFDLPKDSVASGHLNLNIRSSFDVQSNDNEKKAQTDDEIHLRRIFASPANVPFDVNLHPSEASKTPVPQNLEPCVLNGDDAKSVPSGHQQSSASQGAFNLRDIPASNGHKGVNSCNVEPSWYDCVYPFKEGNYYRDSIYRAFHKGIRCDGCGVHPIVGPRFKSRMKDDYDLCDICFSDLGNKDEYIRFDHPVSCRTPRSTKKLNDPHPCVKPVPLPGVLRGGDAKPYRQTFDSHFVRDVSVADGTLMAPNVPFTKIWKMVNNGATAWPYGTRLVWIGGDRFTDRVAVEVEIPIDGFPVDKNLDIAVDFTSPEHCGRYISFWRMSLPSGEKFGQRISILIEVDTSLRGSADTSHEINLNFPPENFWGEGKEIRDLNAEFVKDSMPTRQSEVAAEVLKAREIIGRWQIMNQKLHLPVNGLITSTGASNPFLSKSSVKISDPGVDLPPVSSEPSPVTGMPSRGFTDDNAVEQSLLFELEQMGFKKMGLNKEILRLNKYCLDQSVNDLSGVSDWDPMLEELQEMGFYDKETNKKLLIKNGGSMKQVVMDLIAGKQA